jgi:putative ATPase
LTRAVLEEVMQQKALDYDRDGDAHYDTASAFIKSMRGSDPDAAVYYLARMIEAGEDPRFIARRVVICAAEDVGNADPRALLIAEAVQRSVEKIGMPEGRILLSQAVTYVATAPKSNAAYLAVDQALADIRSGKTLVIPASLRDTHYSGAKDLGRGMGYRYPHDFPGHFVPQSYLAEKRRYYRPSDQGYEKNIRERISGWDRIRRQKRSAKRPYS